MPMGLPSSFNQLPYDSWVITPFFTCFCSTQWNKIEHRLFSFISINWRGKPLRSYRTIVQLIAATTTDTGLKVRAELDENKYPKGVKVSDVQINALNLNRHSFHGDWNYTISPTKKNPRQKGKLT
jgi:Rhodopirellula transposase DDE domain